MNGNGGTIMTRFIHSTEVKKATYDALASRGVTIEEIAKLTYFLQSPYIPELTLDECIQHVQKVLEKREVQNAVLTGIELDVLAEKKGLSTPLQEIVEADESLYGIDEVLALSILNIYGSIGYTNYGYIDKLKHGILKTLNDKTTGKVHTFLDDLVGAIAAAAASRLAHHYRAKVEQVMDDQT
jgi:phosphatidylglycerophosphatase A